MFRDFFDRRPWYYRSVFYAVGFATLTWLISDDSIGWAIFGGLLFSAFMTAFDLIWGRRKRADDS